MKKFFNDFKDFAFKGNAFDMAIGVIIGGVFGTIVSSLVNDIIMPFISVITGKINLSTLFFALNGRTYTTVQEARDAGAIVFHYGSFLQNIINFFVTAIAIFLVVRLITKLKKPAPAAPVTTRECPFCLTNVNIKATRCPCCTSELPEADLAQEAQTEGHA